jgi:UDP-3-O-[3-hydroxymyristoyl] glucosamine N-acyltransferase
MSIKKSTFMLSEVLTLLKQEGFLAQDVSFNEFQLHGFSPVMDTTPNTVSWTGKHLPDNVQLKAAVLLCPPDFDIPQISDIIFIPVRETKRAFAALINEFALDENFPNPAGIAHTARIASDCEIGRDVYIGEYSVLEENVAIGNYTRIGNHVTLKSGTIIGKNCSIFSGSIIGNAGFGFSKAPDGTWERFPHIGRVIIRDYVEIGANTVIDRAALGDTMIGEGTKIDSQVYIAHNAKIGENNIITANVTFAGSVTTGHGVWIGPSSSILEGCFIGDNAYIGMGTVVVKSIDPSQKVVGVPGRAINKADKPD